MKITWLGTAAVRIEAAGERLLFDPFVQLIGGENPNCIEDFLEEETVFVTHGHLDHLSDVPVFLEEEGEAEATVYCGSVAAATLSRLGCDTGNVVEVRPGTEIRLGDVRVKVWPGRHAAPGALRTVRALFSWTKLRYLRNSLALLWLHLHFPEKGQTLIYEVQAEGKRVLVMGSLGIREDAAYPKGADLLILPYQGCARLEETALHVIKTLRPARVLLDHFDNAFPPVSESVDTRGLKKIMEENHLHIPVVRPRAGVAIRL